MKTKVVPVLFVLAIGVIGAGLYFSKRTAVKEEEETLVHAKVIMPKASDAENEEGTEVKNSYFQSENYISLINLYPTETLISSLAIDFNDDGLDDEIDIVRKSGENFFYIVPGLYNPISGVYDRLEDIPTNTSRSRTFSCSGMDIIGDHKTALIFQGVADNGNYEMKIFMAKTQDDKTVLKNIGDFSSDGSVFIQQTERSNSYELSMSKGESFSVWVYKSEKESGDSKGINQIQQEYVWNSEREHYELNKEIKVTASKLAASELSRIQDGTVETFANFLNGLWYKTKNDGSTRYVYFDYEKKEIIQLFDETQEVYEWDDSKLRHNGIYLSTVNADITNFQRRFDIILNSVDEIKITILDTVNLSISESSVWDGTYKKLELQNTYEEPEEEASSSKMIKEIQSAEGWETIDKLNSFSINDGKYTLKTEDLYETGIFSTLEIGNYNVIQFRSDLTHSVLAQNYTMEYGTKVITEVVNKASVDKVVTDYDTLILKPVKITPTECFASEGKIFTFAKVIPEIVEENNQSGQLNN